MDPVHSLFAPRATPPMAARSSAHPCARHPAFATGMFALALSVVAPAASLAQTVKPWVPPHSDSLLVWAAEAKARFMANQGDSTGGPNYRAYEIVGDMGRHLVGSLGRQGMTQANAVEMMLDSLGLDTDVRVDAKHPTFAILMVRDPYHLKARAVGFMLWWKVSDLRMQGVEFGGGIDPQARVWWTGREDQPWEWGIADRTRDADHLGFLLLGMVPSGTYWRILQYDAHGIPTHGASTATWTDVNGDERPELIVFARANLDSTVIPCKECPKVYDQLTFVERPGGFVLMDTRVVPSPVSTLSRFVQLLGEGDRSGASRLLKDPRRIDEAIALGWSGLKRPGSWKILYAEPYTAWPQWLMVRVRGQQRTHDYRIGFDAAYGRWVLGDWEQRDDATTPGFLPPDSTHAARPKTPARKSTGAGR
jgi:hypothetical protein